MASENYSLAFWNVENLFDVEDSPRRSEKLQRAIGKDLHGWTQNQLDRKINQLASIIRQMNEGRGPDLLGVCEIENAYVLKLLVQALASLGRNYETVHHDTSDQRGIDVAYIYDATLFTPEAQFSHVVVRRTATRDLFQVNYRTRHGQIFVVIGNHWPSRTGGQLESAGYRAIAGETLAYFHQRALEVLGMDTPILAVGDFNDEPFDASVTNYALSHRNCTKVMNADIPRFLNLMWALMGKGQGTHYFENAPNVFDQFLVNKNFITQAASLHIPVDSAQILQFPEMIKSGKYPQPLRFGGMGKAIDPNGFSDHYPIAIKMTESY